MIRSGYSFRVAFGHLPDVHSRVIECGYNAAPIADVNSAFGFVRWAKLSAKAKIKPVFGVELNVVPRLGEKKPIIDRWSFYARESLRPLNDLIALATSNPGKEPSITYAQASAASGLTKIAGERGRLDEFRPSPELYIGLSPSISKGYFRAAKEAGFSFVAKSDNVYPRIEDREIYRVALGWRSGTQTYPQHILTDDEWRAALFYGCDPEIATLALDNRKTILDACNAELIKAELIVPERPAPLKEMCEIGASQLGVDLSDPVYRERLERELTLIKEKNFEDYFYILADMINWAKKRMIVGPGRGSSCGSLVCYLLGITAIDPIPYGLIFERFIDINRSDLPDVDCDFSDARRDMVFEYAEEKYGASRVARLGTVGMFKPRSALKQAGISLDIPKWMVERTLEGLITRSSADSRANFALEDTLNETDAGRKLLKEYPEAKIAARMEGHPNNASQHAAGVIITKEPIANYIPFDSRSKSIMVDKKDAEELNLLKIDALGLTQLSVFERTLALIGKPDVNGFLETIPLDDPKAFAVLNAGHFAGIFQFMGMALQRLTQQVKVEKLDDIVAITALARPGPLATGGAAIWVERKTGREPITHIHPLLAEITQDTLGIPIMQEQIMRVVHDIGNFNWEDTSSIRKAMSASKGDEYFESFKGKFIEGAASNGVENSKADDIWRTINKAGSWCLFGATKIRHLGISKGGETIAEMYEYYKEKTQKPWLVSLDPELGARPQKAVNIIKSGRKLCYVYQFDDGSEVICTPQHKFIIEGKWEEIGAANIGSAFLSFKSKGNRKTIWGTKQKLLDKKLISKDVLGEVETYDIEMPIHHNFLLENGLITHNSFNKSHAVAYGIVSYYCCWLKAYYPTEFAAATLDAEVDPAKQITLLRELKDEGVDYIPVDPDYSTERWSFREKDGKRLLVGPLTAIKGIGPASVNEILTARKRGEPIRASLLKRIANAKTDIDSLFPIAERIKALHPDIATSANIVSTPLPVRKIQCGLNGEFLAIAVIKKIAPRDENDPANVQKRGYKVNGPNMALNLFVADDTDEIFAKVNRYKFEKIGREIIERGGVGKACYAIKGVCPSGFRMIDITAMRFLGSLE